MFFFFFNSPIERWSIGSTPKWWWNIDWSRIHANAIHCCHYVLEIQRNYYYYDYFCLCCRCNYCMKTQSFSLSLCLSASLSVFVFLFFSCARRNLSAIRSNPMHNQERERERRLKSFSFSRSDEPNLLEASNAFNDVVRHTSQTRWWWCINVILFLFAFSNWSTRKILVNESES